MAYGRISDKQKEILEYMKQEILNKGYPPTVRDICEAVNLRSTSSVHAHLETLEKNGYITKGEQKYSDKNKRIALSYSINWSKIESFATATDYYEVKSVNTSMDEPKQEEIKTPCIPVEETTEKKPIQERVAELFWTCIPKFQSFPAIQRD